MKSLRSIREAAAPEFQLWHVLLAFAFMAVPFAAPGDIRPTDVIAQASASQPAFGPSGACDGNRFFEAPGTCWKGTTNRTRWWWQLEFSQPKLIGSILLVLSDHSFVLTNAPKSYHWAWSSDGIQWELLPETIIQNEERLFRIQRLSNAISAKFIRLEIDSAHGTFPAIREIEFYPKTASKIAFPDWSVVVNVTHDPHLPGHGQEYIPLVQQSKGWTNLLAQQVWLTTFKESYLCIEPYPLCGFLSGSFKDWCEVDRSTWRGVQEVLKNRNLPIWASCGGAQGLAILEETGVEQPWDCPHCRDPKNPKIPIYGHIGHTASKPCGDYSACLFERGRYDVVSIKGDPAFAGLAEIFPVMQSHCGQIEWAPKGWSVIVQGGVQSQTKVQCLRLDGFPIYAAQFHIEMDGTPETSQRIMRNFLGLAKAWGGYARNQFKGKHDLD